MLDKLNLVGIGEKIAKNAFERYKRYIVQNKVRTILESKNNLTASEIHKCITGISKQGIYEAGKVIKYEVLIDCPAGINKEEFLNRVYEEGRNFQVLKRVCELIKEKELNNLNTPLSINLHPRDFLDQNLEKLLFDTFKGKTDLSKVTLEFLEAEVDKSEFPEIGKRIEELRDLYQVEIALDDFDGSEYMRMLYENMNQHFNIVKISREYFLELFEADYDGGIVLGKKIVDFQYDLKTVIVEGVENSQQYHMVNNVSGVHIQGNGCKAREKV